MLLLALLLGETPLHAAPRQQAQSTLATCTDVDETNLLDELNTVTQSIFADALTRIDVDAVVDRQWLALGMDGVMQAEVDRAVERVKSETDLWNTFLSGWSSGKARELTLAVANATFDAPAFRAAMDQLSSAVAVDIADQVGVLSAESVSAALFCLQTFIQANYSQSLLTAFEENVQKVTSTDALAAGELAPGLLAVIDQHKVALGGVGVIIAAHVTKRIVVGIAERISQRVAGRIVGRVLGRIGTTVIPLAGWLIGAGLIAYDIYDNLDGALPQIQETLKSPELLAAMRAEIAAAISPELQLEMPAIAREIANDLYSQWLAVKREIRVVLELAAESEPFAALLNRAQTDDDLARLVAVVSAALPAVGREAVLAAAQQGTLARLIGLPVDPSPIIQATGSLETTVAWADVAGDLLDEVLAVELFKHLAPADVDKMFLQNFVALEDPAAISRLALLPADQLSTLFTVSAPNLATLAVTLTPEQLGWLGDTLANMDQEQRNLLVARLVSEPALIALLQQQDVLAAIGPAGDLDAAIAFLSAPSDLPGMATDALRVLGGGAPLRLFTVKYGWLTTLMIGLAFLLLGLVTLRLIYALFAWLVAPLSALFAGGKK
jgi:hypothetical protein